MNPEQEDRERGILARAHHEFQKGLNIHAFYKVNDHAIGEDLVQDTFIKTWGYIVRGGKIEIMKAFLYHVLNDLIVDEYRKRKTVSLDVLIKKGFEPSIDGSKQIMSSIDAKEILALIQRLPETYHKVMRMRYVQYLSLEEISLITNQSKNSVAVQSHRGLQKLRVLYNASSAIDSA